MWRALKTEDKDMATDRKYIEIERRGNITENFELVGQFKPADALQYLLERSEDDNEYGEFGVWEPQDDEHVGCFIVSAGATFAHEQLEAWLG